ncbi:MAG: hypothetical protein L0H96_08075 [Humibacillus sp.]|nr:hypothetical protein [Humibacillus sp.]MDN5776851.1 hypothetical protein [Humibacillus sp.]
MVPTGAPPARLARRGVLAIGALGALGLAGGGYAVTAAGRPDFPVTKTREVRSRPDVVARSELTARARIGSAAHRYEVNGLATPYYATDAMAERLQGWLALHRRHTGQTPDRVFTFGAWTRGDGTSWHHSGEAIDIAALRRGGKDVASARYDRWRDDPAAELRGRLRTYWQLAAGLHLQFADVLTYLYDDRHTNHIHVDTGRFGPSGAPRLIQRSRVQTQALQAMCVHVWGRRDVEVTGELDSATRDATSAILRDHGGRGEITDGVEAWQAFLVATMREARDT